MYVLTEDGKLLGKVIGFDCSTATITYKKWGWFQKLIWRVSCWFKPSALRKR